LILKCDSGIEGDFHSNYKGGKEVSLLSIESIDSKEICPRKKKIDKEKYKVGTFNENITTKGIKLRDLEFGCKIKIGKNVILEVV